MTGMTKTNQKVTDAEITAALASSSTKVAAAVKLGINVRTLQRRLEANPSLKPQMYQRNPDGQEIVGVSSLIRVVDPATGEMVLQWIKTRRSREDEQLLNEEILQGFLDQVPRKPAVKPSRLARNEDLLNLHIVTDYHLAMLAWGEETGEPWDLKIAEDLLVRLFEYGIANSPKAKVGVLGQLGDFTHYDSFESITPSSKHLLDSDSRPQKMVRVAIRVLRRVVEMMLKKYETVHVLMAEGNHDIMSSAWLRESFAAMYEHEPRITVETRPDPYYAYEWGLTLLLFHHGHLRKPSNIDSVLTRKFREEYGRCTKVYAHMGHLHHKDEKETALMDVIQHPTIAAMDAYASRHGWLSLRRASVRTYHRKYGEIGDITITPEMLYDEAKRS